MNLRRHALPSVEAQTIAFVDALRHGSHIENAWMTFGGFSVYLRHVRDYDLGAFVLHEALVIGSVDVPRRLQHRGWFWRYMQLCALLVGEGLVLQCVLNKALRTSLRRHSGFEELDNHWFVIRRSPADREPLWLKLAHGRAQDDED